MDSRKCLIGLIVLCMGIVHSRSDDIEDLRVSSMSRFDGNYHTIIPSLKGKVPLADIVINQIGKPLYVQAPQQPLRPGQPSGNRRYKSAEVKSTRAPRLTSATETDLSASSSNIMGLGGGNSCRWIPLKDMRSVNFDTGEIIIRDATDQPCYIMSISAFVKFNDDAYFPLRGFKPYPNGAYNIEYYNHSVEPASSAPYRMPLNCSLPETSSFLIAHDQRPSDYFLFKEKIIIQLDCGYLVFEMKLDYAYQLLLENVSLYQDGEVVSSYQNRGITINSAVKSDKRTTTIGPGYIRPASMQTEHLVFTTSTRSDSDPLIVMPLYSRYICQNRIVLSGTNSTQLVIDRFEFKRLITVPNDKLRINLRHRAHLHSITQCPSPSLPATNLTAMMASANSTGPETTEKSAVSDKLTSDKSSTSRLDVVAHMHLAVILIVAIALTRKGHRQIEA